MTPSFRDWSRLVRVHPRGGSQTAPRTDAHEPDGMMRLYLERELDALGLTMAQRSVALRRLVGEPLASIAESRGTKPGTVSAQFGHIFLKAGAADFEEFSSIVWGRAFTALAAHLELFLLG